MSFDKRFFLSESGLTDQDGVSSLLNMTFESEKDLDEKLWFDPEHASATARNIVMQNKGEITPTFARVALKAMAVPLFKREFARQEPLVAVDDENVTDEYEAHLQALDDHVAVVGEHTAELLNGYLNLIDTHSVNPDYLEQAIIDTTVFQLIARNTEDIILLPIGPTELSNQAATNFTVLRRKSLGRAHLIVNNGAKITHMHNPNVNRHSIQLSTADITGSHADTAIYRLAEAIADEKHGIYDYEKELIAAADARLRAKINAHFDSVES